VRDALDFDPCGTGAILNLHFGSFPGFRSGDFFR